MIDNSPMNTNNWVVYLIECNDNSLYCGITNNLVKRYNAHCSGKGAKYTKGKSPLKLVYVEGYYSKSDASKIEYSIKQFKRNKKISLILSSSNLLKQFDLLQTTI